MTNFRFWRGSLQWKVLLSTSVAVTVLFAVTGWMVLKSAMLTTSKSLADEVQASFQASIPLALPGGPVGRVSPDHQRNVGRARRFQHGR